VIRFPVEARGFYLLHIVVDSFDGVSIHTHTHTHTSDYRWCFNPEERDVGVIFGKEFTEKLKTCDPHRACSS
jgi:hypothetical protein